MTEISLKKITKFYGAIEIIKKIDLHIHSGEFMVFIGPSGCGKSTLLRLISGLGEIDSGEILFDGVSANHLLPSERGIAMVFQSYALYPHMKVYDNMAFGLKLSKFGKSDIENRIQEVANLLQIEALLHRYPKELSGGQRQRVAIGRALVRKPRVFLFDEPLSNLDASLRGAMRLEIAKLHRRMEQVTMIYVTHDQIEAMTLADRITILRDGKIEQVGTPDELYHCPNSLFVAGFIGTPNMNFLTGRFAEDYGCTTLGIRSEHIEVISPTIGLWSGTVVHSENLGADSYSFVEIGAEAPLIVRQAGNEKISLGMQVGLMPKSRAYVHRFDHEGHSLFK